MTSTSRRPDAGAPLRLLALGSSTLWCGVALLVRDAAGARIESAHELAGNEHSRRILPMARSLLDAEGLGWDALDAIAFDCGPGSFTGLRIGCGVAQGLAFALDVPVVGVSSLEALAVQAGSSRAIAALDARMGEVYFADFRRDGEDARREGPVRVLPAEAAADALAERVRGIEDVRELRAVGDAFERFPRLAAAMHRSCVPVDAQAYPRADAIAAIAARRFDAGQAVAAEHAAPLYVRDKVALDVDEQRRAREARGAGARA